ncbi:MAG: 16S rRNA (guanine(966)-N(2))-methyltransferase RsmD [Bacteroidetes bacterium]|nr:16S rRNA (guanine(966)-N(2))-methyltransferase RsmD [Bacteroidota bacterium]
MRIISGAYKGRKLFPPDGNNVRPTSDRAKESLFNILQNRIDFDEMKCMDLFCGSGALGLEALSRGASFCVFADVNTDTVSKNVKYLSAEASCRIVRSDALNFLRENKEYFDVIFCDPPYSYEGYDEIIKKVSETGSYFILEHTEGFRLNAEFEKYLVQRKKTGTVNFSIMDFNSDL